MILGENLKEWQRRALIYWYETGREAKDLLDLRVWWDSQDHTKVDRALRTFISYNEALQSEDSGKVMSNVGEKYRAVVSEMVWF